MWCLWAQPEQSPGIGNRGTHLGDHRLLGHTGTLMSSCYLSQSPHPPSRMVSVAFGHSGLSHACDTMKNRPYHDRVLAAAEPRICRCWLMARRATGGGRPLRCQLDIIREGPAAMLTFGGGVHYCLGSHLARLELAEALRVITLPNA